MAKSTGLGPEALNQIREVVRMVLKDQPNSRLQPKRRHVSITPDRTMHIGKTNAAIPGRDDATGTPVAGSGDVTLWKLNASNEMIETEVVVEAFNIVTSEVADDTFVVIEREALSGRYIIIVEDCG